MSDQFPEHKLRSVANTLVTQAALYAELAGVEWQEEKSRLTGMLVYLLLGFTFLFCLLLAISAMVLMASWDTAFRLWSLLGLMLVYAAGAVFALKQFNTLGKGSEQAFCDLRAELAVDIALLRTRLER